MAGMQESFKHRVRLFAVLSQWPVGEVWSSNMKLFNGKHRVVPAMDIGILLGPCSVW